MRCRSFDVPILDGVLLHAATQRMLAFPVVLMQVSNQGKTNVMCIYFPLYSYYISYSYIHIRPLSGYILFVFKVYNCLFFCFVLFTGLPFSIYVPKGGGQASDTFPLRITCRGSDSM